jgi:glycosyltransferase involved in cell wall biosynthesis
MEKRKAIIVRGSSLDRETRATKIIKILSENNYEVHLLWWNRSSTTQRSERGEAGTQFSETSFNFNSPIGLKCLIFLPFWWVFVFFNLLTKEWDIVHAIQIISLPPAVVAGKIKRKPVVYDMLDTYEDSIFLPRIIRNLCVAVDKLFMRFVDAVVLADEEQVQEVNGIPNDNVEVIYDSPETNVEIHRKNTRNEVFTLFFAGSLHSGKYLNLDKIFEALRFLNGVKVIIAGYGNLVPDIKNAEERMPGKVKYIGEISHADVLQQSADADLLFMLRDPVLPVNKYICGSKILESMMCGTAIIVNDGSSTANIVRKTNCGLVVNAHSVKEVVSAINELKNNPEMCTQFGINGRNAYDITYSWDIMGNRLLMLYERILTRNTCS